MTRLLQTWCFTVIGVALTASAIHAQAVISARSGLLHYLEGDVLVAGKPVELKFADYPQIGRDETIKTERGRAEVLLTPGVFLRLPEESEVRMLSTRVDDVQIELLSGTALIEAGEVQKNQPIQVKVGDSVVEVHKRGLVRIESDPAQVKVYDGQAILNSGGQMLTLKEGKSALLSSVLSPEKFDKKSGDAFIRWAGRRANYLALANISSAKSIHDRSIPWNVSGWFYNPYFGSYTYIPYQGRYFSPFGFSYYGPRTVQRLYVRPQPMGAMRPDMSMGQMSDRGGYRSYGGNSSGGYRGMAPSSSAGSVQSTPAPAPRGASSGGSRQGRGGR